jgi:2-methylcitrate dehydratase PrpD
VFDFDDTHLKTVIHPAGPVVSALLALAEHRPMSGRAFLTSMVVGIETECRIGNAVYPAHYDRGWHITGTAGVFGAAAACGRALGLSEQQMLWALGLAATQPVGLREMFGTMTKSFHPGRAAQNGLTAALLASRGFTSTEVALEGKSGWAHVLSTSHDYTQAPDDRCLHPAAQRAQADRRRNRADRLASPSARARTDRQEDAHDRTREQIQCVLRRCSRRRRRLCRHA